MSSRRDGIDSRHPAICLLGLTYATSNLGVNALTDGALRCVLRRFPEARISLLDYGRSSESFTYRHDGGDAAVAVVPMRFSKHLFLPNNIALLIAAALLLRLIPFGRMKARWAARWPVLQHLSSVDIAAAGSGGDSFSDIYGLRRFLFVSLPQILVLLMGRRLVLLPQTIGPFRHPLARALARGIMRRSALVYSRDRTGLQRARQLCGTRRSSGRVRFCYDMAFAVEPSPSSPQHLDELTVIAQPRPLVGLNVSGLLYIGGYTRRNMFGLKADYPRLLGLIVDTVLRRHDGDIVLVPHVFGANNAESDEAACHRLCERLRMITDTRRIHIPPLPYDQRDVKLLIGRCELFIGSRMHACIAALSQGVPAIGIAYSRKFAGVMETLGLESLAIDLRTETADSVVRMIDNIYDSRRSVRAALDAKLPEVKQRVLGLFDDISEGIDHEG